MELLKILEDIKDSLASIHILVRDITDLAFPEPQTWPCRGRRRLRWPGWGTCRAAPACSTSCRFCTSHLGDKCRVNSNPKVVLNRLDGFPKSNVTSKAIDPTAGQYCERKDFRGFLLSPSCTAWSFALVPSPVLCYRPLLPSFYFYPCLMYTASNSFHILSFCSFLLFI